MGPLSSRKRETLHLYCSLEFLKQTQGELYGTVKVLNFSCKSLPLFTGFIKTNPCKLTKYLAGVTHEEWYQLETKYLSVQSEILAFFTHYVAEKFHRVFISMCKCTTHSSHLPVAVTLRHLRAQLPNMHVHCNCIIQRKTPNVSRNAIDITRANLAARR